MDLGVFSWGCSLVGERNKGISVRGLSISTVRSWCVPGVSMPLCTRSYMPLSVLMGDQDMSRLIN